MVIKINNDWKFEPSPPPQTTGYTTTYNCLAGNYPVRESIMSWSWLEKIVVVDGGSIDGTRELLEELRAELNGKLEVIDIPIQMDSPGKDGYQKSMAYAMCDTPLAIQFDIDEVCRGSVEKWKNLLRELPENADILNLPVLEPYGSLENARLNKEHNPTKWRVFRVKPEITHGIPKQDQVEVNGQKASRGGSDGCTPIHVVTENPYPSKMTNTSSKLFSLKNEKKFDEYASLWNEIVSSGDPYVLHLGHVDLKNKIKHYLSTWRVFWANLYGKDPEDPKNNMFFPGVHFSQITDEMIDKKVKELVDTTPSFKLSY